MKRGSGGCQPSFRPMPFKPAGQCQPNLADGRVLREKSRVRSEILSSYLLCLPVGSRHACAGWAERWDGSEDGGEPLPLKNFFLPLKEGFSWETWFWIVWKLFLFVQECEKSLSKSDFINPLKNSLWRKHLDLFQWMLPLCILYHNYQRGLRDKFCFDFPQNFPFKEHRPSFQVSFMWERGCAEMTALPFGQSPWTREMHRLRGQLSNCLSAVCPALRSSDKSICIYYQSNFQLRLGWASLYLAHQHKFHRCSDLYQW